MNFKMTNVALVVGASGIVGNNLARYLIKKGWQVHGLARRPPADIEGMQPVAANLLDPTSLQSALAEVRPSHVFFSAWMRQATEAENITVNSAMVRNVLDALSPAKSVRHVALVTGLKHYLGPFEAYGKGTLPATPFREEQPRLEIENFYYAQED
ncbi:MAG: NAD-dependent epimerase/dehydratase, partial [Chthoniobacteraceae bacterium]|nr:NAD-dependent epimerase/dehydratase [Chthoniobacteraceae bacterium]